MTEILIFIGGVLFISFFISVYFRSVCKEFFRLKEIYEDDMNAFIEYMKQFINEYESSNNRPTKEKQEQDEEDVAYMRAYV